MNSIAARNGGTPGRRISVLLIAALTGCFQQSPNGPPPVPAPTPQAPAPTAPAPPALPGPAPTTPTPPNPTAPAPTTPTPPALPDPASPQASDFETDEYFARGASMTWGAYENFEYYGLDLMKASSAYAAGATGKGIKIAIIDGGIDSSIEDLSGQVEQRIQIYEPENPSFSEDGQIAPINAHGALVSALIAAKKNDSGFHGIAYESSLIDVFIDLNAFNLADAVNQAAEAGARIISISAGAPVIFVGSNAPPTPEEQANAVEFAARVFFDLSTITTNNVILVASAGNGGNDEPVQDAAQPNYPAFGAAYTQADGLIVAVGSVDPNGKISEFSNRAGLAQDFYLLAPGGFDGTQRKGIPSITGQGAVAGTSFSTPLVAGSLALLLDAFPTLTSRNAVRLLLDTADDYIDAEIDAVAGVAAGPGSDPVGGRGIVNLQRAFQPQGTMTVATAGRAVPLAQALAPSGPVFGDWATEAFDGVVAQDSYGRGFTINSANTPAQTPYGRFVGFAPTYGQTHAGSTTTLGGLAQLRWSQTQDPIDPIQRLTTTPQDSIDGSVAFNGGRISFGFNTPATFAPRGGNSLLSDAGTRGENWVQIEQKTALGVAFVSTSASPSRQTTLLGMTRSGDGWRLRVSSQSGQENGSALGGQVLSRIGHSDSAGFTLATLDGDVRLGPATVSASLTTGSTSIAGGHTSDITVSAWSASVATALAGGTVSLGVSQPLRAESGWIDFSAPVAVSEHGYLIHQTQRASLTPSGREIDIEARWSRFMTDRSTGISLQTALATHPYHVSGSPSAFALLGTIWKNW